MPMIRAQNRENDFSIEHYREILAELVKSHRPLSFKDANELGRGILDLDRFVIMRHDIEFSLTAALRMAEADAEAGVRATYFLLQTSDYNCFEEEEAEKVRRILELGHDIGLHYDAALFEKLGVDAALVARRQVDMFEAFFRTRVYAMSSHMPMRSGRTFSLPGIVDTYDPLYLVDMKYVSDSTQSWREGVVTGLLDRYPHLHLLTHEYIWHPEGHNWDTLLLVEAHDKFQSMWQRALRNMQLYREGLSMRAHKDREFKKRFFQADAPSQ